MANFEKLPSLRELLTAAAAVGGEWAIEELDRRYSSLVFRITLSQLRRQGCNDSYGHSEEIISAVWVAVVMFGYQLDDEDRFPSWLDKVISNLVSAHVRGDKGCIRRQQKTIQLDPARDAGIKDTKNIIEANVWVNEMVDRAYEHSFLFGEIVRLHLVEGYTLEQVAEMLGESYAKLRSFYYRSRNEFRKHFTDGRKDGGGSDDGDEDDDGSPYEN